MLISLRATPLPSCTVTLGHCWAPLWNESSQSRQFHHLSLRVANLSDGRFDFRAESGHLELDQMNKG